MIIEIISLIIVLIVGCSIWVLKGGTIKGFIIFVLVFLIGGLSLVISMNHLDRWRQSKQEKEFSEMTEEEHKESIKERLKNLSENYEEKNN